jgi:hypothetical protein
MKNIVLSAIAFLMIGCSGEVEVTQEREPIETKGEIVKQLFQDTCSETNEVYYATQADNVTYFTDTRDYNSFWDNRYGDITVNGCEVTISVDDTTPPIVFGGPQSTLLYRFNDVYPWADGNSLMLQTNFTEVTVEGNMHGGISFNFFIINRYTKQQLNYVISMHTYGVAWTQEVQEILYDPTTDTKFISTTVDVGNTYIKISPISTTLNTAGFYRVIIDTDSLPIDNPEDWYLPFVGIQYEVEESISRGSINAEFSDFGAYIIKGEL